MKAIILAAGEGKRLRPLTNLKPKSMVKFFDKSILEQQISIMKRCGIDDIIIVTGYKSELIKFPNIKYRNNSNFQNTNMVETLFCAQDDLKGDVIISYADILYEVNILKKLIDSNHDISVIIDKQWKKYWKKRFENPLNDAETLKIDLHNNIYEIGQKTDNIDEIEGQFIGLMKFNPSGLKKLKNFYKKCKETSITTGKNLLNPNLSFENSYMTDLLQGLINEGYELKPVIINGRWIELDSIDDYNLYKKLYQENKLTELINLEK